MVQSILVYGLLGLTLFVLGKRIAVKDAFYNKHFDTSYTFYSPEMLLMLLSFGFVMGARWDVGTDHLSYLDIYNHLIKHKELWRREDSMEGGFVFFTKLFTSLNIHYSVYFGVLGMLQFLFLFLTFRKNKYVYPYLGLILVLGPLFLSWSNGIRQTLAICIFMYASTYIVEKKPLRYIFWIFIASLFHLSAWILLPVYFLAQKRVIINNRALQVLVFAGAIFLGFNHFWLESVSQFENVISFLGYERYANKLENFIYEDVSKNFGARTLSVLVVQVFIILFSKNMLNSYNDKRLVFFYNLFFIGIILYYMFFNTSHVFLRVVMFYQIVNLFFSALLLHYLYNKSKIINLIRMPLFIILLTLAISYTFVAAYSDLISAENRYALYEFFWQQ